MDPLFIFLAVIVISVVKWAMSNRADGQDQTPRSERTTARPNPSAAQSEQERLRKFLEALGVPAGEMPPPTIPQKSPSGEMRSVRPVPENRPHESAAPHLERKRKSPPPPLTPVDGFPGRQKIQPFVRKAPPVLPPAPVAKTAPIAEILVAPMLPQAAEDMHYQEHRQEDVALEPVPEPAPGTSGARLQIHDWLRNPDDLRRAIILREIFNPPKGLQLHDDSLHSRLA